jgi:hypothetical protein
LKEKPSSLYKQYGSINRAAALAGVSYLTAYRVIQKGGSKKRVSTASFYWVFAEAKSLFTSGPFWIDAVSFAKYHS